MTALMRKTLALAGAVVVLAGCVPGSGTPVPTFQCTGADPDGPKTPCSQEEFETQQKTYYLEREAMEVYEEYWAVLMALLEEGAPEDAEQRLSPYLADPDLGVETTLLRRHREMGLVSARMKHSLTMWPSRADAVEGSLVTIVGCEDTRGSTFEWSTREPTQGILTRTARHFKRVDGRLKSYDITEREVERCDR